MNFISLSCFCSIVRFSSQALTPSRYPRCGMYSMLHSCTRGGRRSSSARAVSDISACRLDIVCFSIILLIGKKYCNINYKTKYMKLQNKTEYTKEYMKKKVQIFKTIRHKESLTLGSQVPYPKYNMKLKYMYTHSCPNQGQRLLLQ